MVNLLTLNSAWRINAASSAGVHTLRLGVLFSGMRLTQLQALLDLHCSRTGTNNTCRESGQCTVSCLASYSTIFVLCCIWYRRSLETHFLPWPIALSNRQWKRIWGCWLALYFYWVLIPFDYSQASTDTSSYYQTQDTQKKNRKD